MTRRRSGHLPPGGGESYPFTFDIGVEQLRPKSRSRHRRQLTRTSNVRNAIHPGQPRGAGSAYRRSSKGRNRPPSGAPLGSTRCRPRGRPGELLRPLLHPNFHHFPGLDSPADPTLVPRTRPAAENVGPVTRARGLESETTQTAMLGVGHPSSEVRFPPAGSEFAHPLMQLLAAHTKAVHGAPARLHGRQGRRKPSS